MAVRLTAAEKQKRYRERQDARRNEDAGLATEARNIIYWLERAREQGVKQVTLPVGPLETARDFAAQLRGIQSVIASETARARMGETTGKRERAGAIPPVSPAGECKRKYTRKSVPKQDLADNQRVTRPKPRKAPRL